AIIKGTISMIMAGDDGEISEEIRDDLKDVMVVVERQIRLVNELLDISRIEAGVIYFNLLSELDIVYVAHLLEASLNLVADQNGVRIVVVDSPGIPKIQGDQDKLSQVLINLVTNALKFTKNGTITISFKQDGNFIVISVTDTGSGMPAETKDELFKKFTKPGDPTVSTMSAGSGLGLYISKKFIEHHGGKLWLENSEPGKGSTFCFSLPVSGTPEAKKVVEDIAIIQNLKQVHLKNKEGSLKNE
ncbi:MAG: HAMP domain-containing sensor histidine kinase, partial [Candidatus Magasanikbacteria bacterium]|nr:HAMP domain-containing sensor histidine kinase [Candidatus Magasanikbacteria bacterium]